MNTQDIVQMIDDRISDIREAEESALILEEIAFLEELKEYISPTQEAAVHINVECEYPSSEGSKTDMVEFPDQSLSKSDQFIIQYEEITENDVEPQEKLNFLIKYHEELQIEEITEEIRRVLKEELYCKRVPKIENVERLMKVAKKHATPSSQWTRIKFGKEFN